MWTWDAAEQRGGKAGCWSGWYPLWVGSSLSVVPVEDSRAPSSLYQCVFEVRSAEPHHTQLEHQKTAGDCRELWERPGWAGQNPVGEGGGTGFH